ncbi:hypothetical protein PANDA_019613 [Ailuropoda melanoleuca]|uniref:NTR domain-containing protein n=1 Tax=Ailuropoda melanoleuca TaxID=9646 RepID=D2I2I7_AILME|nr:hypothetical protein PANDA_019613 [Ailuropoda melanoleuca]
MDPAFLLAFPLLLTLSTPYNACRCKIQHPQTYYCMSDVVILADILGPANNTRTKRGFRVNVIKVLKAPQGTPRIHEIYSPISWGACGYRVRTSQQSLLLIAGYLKRGMLHFTRCHLVYFWYRLTREQKLGFEAVYRTGCKCEGSGVVTEEKALVQVVLIRKRGGEEAHPIGRKGKNKESKGQGKDEDREKEKKKMKQEREQNTVREAAEEERRTAAGLEEQLVVRSWTSEQLIQQLISSDSTSVKCEQLQNFSYRTTAKIKYLIDAPTCLTHTDHSPERP